MAVQRRLTEVGGRDGTVATFAGSHYVARFGVAQHPRRSGIEEQQPAEIDNAPSLSARSASL
jgi:hypothetical protein